MTAAMVLPSGVKPVGLVASKPRAGGWTRQGPDLAESRTAATASPSTSPSRPASRGLAPVGDSSHREAKPAGVYRFSSSTPSTSASSAWPPSMRPTAASRAWTAEVQALEKIQPRPCRPQRSWTMASSSEGSGRVPPASEPPMRRLEVPRSMGVPDAKGRSRAAPTAASASSRRARKGRAGSVAWT